MSVNNPNRRVAIVVDSAASVPEEFRDDPLTFIVPMRLHVGSEEFRDGVDLSATDFYKLQKQNAGHTSTSAPTPGDFMEAYRAASRIAESALCITVSSAFSSTVRSAQSAWSQVANEIEDFEVRVLDSRSAVGGQGLIAWEALKSSTAGLSLEEVEQAAVRTSDRVGLLAYVDTLYYLWKGGRVPSIAHAAVSFLSLKPIFELRHSKVNNLARPRTSARAQAKLVSLMADRVDGSEVHAVVMHAEACDEVQMLRQTLEHRFNCVELFETEFTPVIGAHIGPGLVGVAFWSEPSSASHDSDP